MTDARVAAAEPSASTDAVAPTDAPTAGIDVVDAVVVGAGFAGMYALHRLRRAGFRTRAFEAATDVGGTWWWNRYPGARCDIESFDYSFSFDPELEQEWTWSERYAAQPEILAYAGHVADRLDLRPLIQFQTRVLGATWLEGERRWEVRTDRGDVVRTRFVIMAVGCLSAAKQPEIEGIDDFDGLVVHTGHWPHEGVDVRGQRVGVIGTGSSGIQAIPLLAEDADHLTVFQRTPNFAQPAMNRALPPEVVAERKARYREHRAAARHSHGGVLVDRADRSAFDVDDEERRAYLLQRWESGHLFGLLGAFNDVMLDEGANELAAEFVRDQIRAIVDDPDVAERLCPRGYPFGAKRVCLDTGYYATFNRPDVTLVDLRETPIERVTPVGVRTTAEEVELDVLVFATGFDAMTGALLRPDIVGRDGKHLRQKWTAGPRTYLGLATHGFPNLFTITGPGSPSVLTNMLVSIEQHVDWVADCLERLRDDGVEVIEADLAAEDRWVEHVNELAEATLWTKGNSWYLGANVPGKPRVFMPYVGGVELYRAVCDDVVAKGYDGFLLEPAPSP